MKTKKENRKQATPSQEEVFREKTHNYLVCFIESCPLKDQCLRWLVGQYADTMPFAQKSVNPRNPQIGGEHCAKFRPNIRVVKKQGMTNFYYDMPGHMEHSIRQELRASASFLQMIRRSLPPSAAPTAGMAPTSTTVSRKIGCGSLLSQAYCSDIM